jgi:Calcineurin-like phosphoesterase
MTAATMRGSRMLALLLAGTLAAASAPPASPPAAAAATAPLALPLKEGSLRFAVIGDSGTGTAAQSEVARLLAEWRASFPFELVLMMGDNIYGRDDPRDYRQKFEEPYRTLLDAGVKFYAALGNHDDPKQRFYEKFNMGGERYYSFKAPGGGVRFFALDSNYMDKPQLEWLEKELAASGSDWKIVFFHHPLYSSGDTHGSDLQLREQLEPLFLKHGVDAVFGGHEHFYERIKPQKGIYYFISGGAGKVRKGDVKQTNLTAKAFDTGYHFMIIELTRDTLHFQVISDQGQTVDSGALTRFSDADKKKLATG